MTGGQIVKSTLPSVRLTCQLEEGRGGRRLGGSKGLLWTDERGLGRSKVGNEIAGGNRLSSDPLDHTWLEQGLRKPGGTDQGMSRDLCDRLPLSPTAARCSVTRISGSGRFLPSCPAHGSHALAPDHRIAFSEGLIEQHVRKHRFLPQLAVLTLANSRSSLSGRHQHACQSWQSTDIQPTAGRILKEEFGAQVAVELLRAEV